MTWSGSSTLRQMMAATVKDDCWVSQLYTMLLRSTPEWGKHDLGWREVALAVGSLQSMFFENKHRHAMLAMWCMTLTAKAADGDDLRSIVENIFIDDKQFKWPTTNTPTRDDSIQSAETIPLKGIGNSFRQIKSILQETENRVSADEALLLLKVLAGNGGVRNILTEGCEPILIQASAPLRPVAVTNGSGEQSPIWDESTLQNIPRNEGDECLVMWSDGKMSSITYISTCWRELGLDCCCHIVKFITNESDITELSKDWGHQLALDSTSEWTMSVLERVSHLSSSYLITTNLLRPIVHRARPIHKYSVLTHLIAEHPEYFTRRWFLEAVILSNERDRNLKTVQHIVLELHRTIVECNIDPCFRSELEKTLSVFMGWSSPNRSGDSSSPSPELLAEIASCAKTVVDMCPISRFKSEPYSVHVLKHVLCSSVIRDVNKDVSDQLGRQWAMALSQIYSQFFSKECVESAGSSQVVPSELLVGMVPSDGDSVTGLIRILATLPSHHSVSEKTHSGDSSIVSLVLKIWESEFPSHPLGTWSDLAAPVNLIQVSPHTRFEYTLAWHSLSQSGDTTLIKNKCLTPTFIRRLLYLTTVLKGFSTATLTGPPSYKDSLVETYCKLSSKSCLTASPIDVYQLTEWLKAEHDSTNKYANNKYQESVIHLLGVVPDPNIIRLAKSKEVEIVHTISEKQFNSLTGGFVDIVACDPLPVDEVAMITRWMLKVNNNNSINQISIEKVVNLLAAYYTASQRTSAPLTLSCISDISLRLVDDNVTAEDLGSVLLFELVSRLPSLSLQDRAIIRHAIRSTKTEIALKFEEAAKDESPEVESEIQIHIQHESQSRVTSFVKDKFRAGRNKFRNIFSSHNDQQPSPAK